MEKVSNGYNVTGDEMVELMMGIMERLDTLDERRQYVDDRFHDYWEEEYQKCDAIYTAFYGYSYKEAVEREKETMEKYGNEQNTY